MTADIEHGIEIIRFQFSQLGRVSKRFLRLLVFLEAGHRWCLVFRKIALWIDRRLAPLSEKRESDRRRHP
jgi:hypothetical protein